MSSLLSLEEWRALLVIGAVAGALYFGLAKRHLDFFTLGFASSVIYFIPGFFGYALRVNERGEPFEPDPLDPRAYAIMVAVVVAISLTAMFFDQLRTPSPRNRSWAVSPRVVLWTIVIMGGIAAVMTLLTTGRALMAPTKFEIIPYLNRWIVIVHYAAADALVLAAAIRSWRGMLAAGALLSLSMLAGARSVSALALMAVVMLSFSRHPRGRFLRTHWKIISTALPVGLFFFVWPQLFWIAKSADWPLLRERATAAETYVDAIRAFEPFVIQENLNQIIKSGLTIPAEDLWSIAAVAVPFYTELLPRPRSFEDRFHPVLFPEIVLSTLIGNFWAQGYALGGGLGVALFLGLYLGGLWIGSRLLRRGTPILGSTVAIAFSYFAFYSHRNEISYLLILMRGHALVMLTGVVAAWFIKSVYRRSQLSPTTPIDKKGPATG